MKTAAVILLLGSVALAELPTIPMAKGGSEGALEIAVY